MQEPDETTQAHGEVEYSYAAEASVDEDDPSTPLGGGSRMLPPAAQRRRAREPLTSPQNEGCLSFFLTHLKAADDDRMFMRGIINDPTKPNAATNVGVVVYDVKRYFFIHFKSDKMSHPSLDPNSIERCLRFIEDHCLRSEYYHIPQGGDITAPLQKKYNPLFGATKEASSSAANTNGKNPSWKEKQAEEKKKYIKRDELGRPQLFTAWRDVSGLYKTVYGYTPEPMQGLIQVYVTHHKVVSVIPEFLESQQYCRAVAKFYPHYMVRTFEATKQTPEQQFALDYGLKIGTFCSLYVNEDHRVTDDERREIYGDREYHIDESQVFPFSLPELPLMPMMNVVSFDIETNNKTIVNPITGLNQTRFSKPLWTPAAVKKYLQEQLTGFSSGKEYRLKLDPNDALYKKLVAMEEEFTKAIEALQNQLVGMKPWTNMMDWYEAAVASYGYLAPYLDIPDPLDTDEVIMIVAVNSVFNKPRERPLKFDQAVAFVLVHEGQESPIDRHTTPSKYRELAQEYEHIDLRLFDSSQQMRAAFAEWLHETAPTIITGWNDSEFDFPFLWARNQFFATYYRHLANRKNSDQYKYQYLEHGQKTEFGNPNFGMLRRFELSKYVEGRDFKEFKNKTSDSKTDGDDDADDEDAASDDGGSDDEAALYNMEKGGGKKKKKKSKKKGVTANNNPSRISQSMARHVTLPMVTNMDGIAVWKNPSFGVKSTIKSKGNTPQYSLNNVAVAELIYPKSKITMPMRKLEVSHSETPNTWKRGGSDLWFFVCYCFVDTILPLLLLEKYGKIQLMFSIATKCNCSLDIIYNNGMQVKVMALLFASSRVYENGLKLVPEWGYRGLHWPDIWYNDNPYTRAFSFVGLKPRPPGTKGYMGAEVFPPSRQLNFNPIATKDMASFYPTTASAYGFDYDKFLTQFTQDYFKLPSNEVLIQPLGTKKAIFCGEDHQDEYLARYDFYNTPMLKVARWRICDGGFMNFIITDLKKDRSAAKNRMAEWTYYNKMVSTPQKEWPPSKDSLEFAAWNRNDLVPATLKEKLGRYWQRMNDAAASLETWTTELEKINPIMAKAAQPGISDMEYVTSSKVEENNADQLGLKLLLNSMYGFFGADPRSALLPLMEGAASITSMCRRLIRMTASFCESRTIGWLKGTLDKIDKNQLDPSPNHPLTRGVSNVTQVLNHSKILWTFPLDSLVTLTTTDDAMDVDGDDDKPTKSPPKNGWLASSLQLPRIDDFITSPEELKLIRSHFEQRHLNTHLILCGGDTDSVFISYPRHAILKSDPKPDEAKEDYPLVQRMAALMANTITKFMHGAEELTQEKTSKLSLMVDPKNYYMSVLGAKELLSKGVEIVRGDSLMITNRLVGYAAKELIHKGRYDTFKDSFVRVFRYVQHELIKVAQGKVILSEFTKSVKVAKFTYKNMPEHVIVAQKMAARGHPIEAGDFVTYTYADTINLEDETLRHKRFDRDGLLKFITKKGGAIAEDVNYMMEIGANLDVEHVLQIIMNPIIKFFRHIVAPKIYPIPDLTSTKAEQARITQQMNTIRAQQNAEIEQLLFENVLNTLKERLQLRMLNIQRLNTMTLMITGKHKKECGYCAKIYETVNRDQRICDECLESKADIIRTLDSSVVKINQDIEEAQNVCLTCVDYAGFPDIPIDRCQMHSCENHEALSRLKLNRRQLELQTRMLTEAARSTMGPQDDAADATRKLKRPRIEVAFDQ